MPFENPDPADPLTLHGVGVATENEAVTRDMAACFVEEFLRMGFDRQRLLALFSNPRYAGPYLAFRELGEEVIAELIDDLSARR